MYCIHFLWILLLFEHTIKASHFRGGTITWKPINNNITNGTISIIVTQTYCWTRSQIGCNSSMIATQSPPINLGTKAGSGMNLMCNDSCSTSGGYVGNEVPITGYCCDYSTALDLTISQRSDIVNLTVGAHFTVTFGTSGGWQTLALGSSTGWSLSSLIDLGLRPDNGLINTPPVATAISYISVPVNIQQTIQIPVLDADNDFLRCRFANGSSECLNACPPGSLPSGTTLSSSCTLEITGTTAGDYYLVAIQVEDFITNTSIIPLSSVPLQFLIYVYATPNCTLKPLLVSDLNNNDCQGAQVGVNFTMTLTAINRCGSGQTINEIATLSFPVVIKSALVQNTTNTSLWSMTITWMPMANQVGSQVFCAVAADSANVQSDQYCVTLFVGLTSVPLCPGATAAPTTMITTKQTSTVLGTITSQKESQISTEVITTMDITSSSIVGTSTTSISSSLSTSTDTPKNTINWPLILGLCLAALALALCCALCCYYHLLGPGAYRRRRKKTRASEHNIEWCQQNENSYQKLSPKLKQDQHKEREQDVSIINASDLRILSSVTVTKINQREKSLIDSPGNITIKKSSEETADLSSQSSTCINVQQIDRRDKIPQPMTLDDIPSILQDSNDLLTTPLSPSTIARTKLINVIKIPRRLKSSVGQPRPTSTVSVKIQPTKNSHNGSNDSEGLKTNNTSASTVSVRRVRRSSLPNQINRITTATTIVDLSRVTDIKMK